MGAVEVGRRRRLPFAEVSTPNGRTNCFFFWGEIRLKIANSKADPTIQKQPFIIVIIFMSIFPDSDCKLYHPL